MRSARALVTPADTRPRVKPCRHQRTFSSSPSRLLHATRMLITTRWRLIPLVWNRVYAPPCSTLIHVEYRLEVTCCRKLISAPNHTCNPIPGRGFYGLANPFTTATPGISACIVSAGRDPPTLAGRSPARPCWKQATLGLRPEAAPHLRATCSW